jgi:hypothetical protein
VIHEVDWSVNNNNYVSLIGTLGQVPAVDPLLIRMHMKPHKRRLSPFLSLMALRCFTDRLRAVDPGCAGPRDQAAGDGLGGGQHADRAPHPAEADRVVRHGQPGQLKAMALHMQGFTFLCSAADRCRTPSAGTP